MSGHVPDRSTTQGRGHGHGHGHGRGVLARLGHLVVPHSHDPGASIQTAEETSGQGIRAAWISLGGMVVTAALQLVIVALSGSVALLADTVHNLGHAVTTIPLVVAFRLGRRAATERYSYGYRRAEDLAGVFIALVIAASVVLILWESVDALLNPRPLTNLAWVFAAGLVGFAGNELVAAYRIRTGRRIGSAALIAEGQHARADGWSSLAVVAGVLGVWLGFGRADAIVGLLIGLLVLGILVSTMRTVFRRLMDGVEPGVVDAMTATAASVDGVLAVDRLRVRWSGHRLEGDADIAVPGELTVLEGHRVADRVEHELLHATPHLEAVVVHLHPVVDGERPHDLHELSGHHAGPAARAAYRARQGAWSGPASETDGS
ncbi:cation diffusion facilitator family transporter [Prauserella muralis]|nr:cation diffusion facilitator family transporter [Prauserella muralis]TWE22923.1 cation diffusion facilitator family transporter [Prauserella muralis]